MRNKKAFELAISTLIIMVLAVIVLIGLIYFVTNGFKSFTSTSNTFLKSTEASAFKTACELGCNNKLTYCCLNATVQNQNLKCTDSRLEIQCSTDCNSFNCTPQ